MIELRIRPGAFVVTVVAGLAEVACVPIVRTVTSDASRIGVAKALVGGVAALAGLARVTTEEWKVRRVVIEGVSVEGDDIRIAALVLRMAGSALGCRDRCKAAVKAFACREIVVDLGMTVETQCTLVFAGERGMTRSASVLVIGMIGGDRPRHQDALEYLRRCPIRSKP